MEWKNFFFVHCFISFSLLILQFYLTSFYEWNLFLVSNSAYVFVLSISKHTGKSLGDDMRLEIFPEHALPFRQPETHSVAIPQRPIDMFKEIRQSVRRPGTAPIVPANLRMSHGQISQYNFPRRSQLWQFIGGHRDEVGVHDDVRKGGLGQQDIVNVRGPEIDEKRRLPRLYMRGMIVFRVLSKKALHKNYPRQNKWAKKTNHFYERKKRTIFMSEKNEPFSCGWKISVQCYFSTILFGGYKSLDRPAKKSFKAHGEFANLLFALQWKRISVVHGARKVRCLQETTTAFSARVHGCARWSIGRLILSLTLYCPAVFGLFSSAPVKTDRAIRIH